ncbi:MAG: VWA domain-containing protein [Isosphaeraceae bacterium]|nr:VWA domain-containing protein [Isosphaeraceae bacterium]
MNRGGSMEGLLLRLADALGVEPAQAGEAITPRIRAEQPLPQGPTILFVIFAIGLIAWLYRREGKVSTAYKVILASLRVALVLLALFMLSEAVLSVDRTGLPFFVVMIDDSASSLVTDQYGDEKVGRAASDLAKKAGSETVDRIAQAKGWLLADNGAALRELRKQHRVRIYLVSSGTKPLAEIDKPADVDEALPKIRALEATGEQTRLGAGVVQVLTELRGTPPTAILLLTDGQTTDGETLADAAKISARKGVPLYAVGLGDAEAPRDLELTELLVDDVVFVDDLVRFQPRLISRGFAGKSLTLRLLEKDSTSTDPKAERLIETKSVVAPPDGQPARLEITHRPKKTGAITYVVEITPEPRELSDANNRIERVVNVREEKLKVLYVENEPRYEFRYLKTFLQREKSVDLKVVLLASDPEYSNQDLYAIPTFPASKDELFAFDVVIVGDADPSYFSAGQMANLAEFVTEKGGGVMFVAGDNFNPLSFRNSPLEVLLPIELQDARNPTATGTSVLAFRPSLTAEGRSSPIFRFGDDEVRSAQIWAGLPELYWFFEAPRKKPAALVLAEHPTQNGSDGPVPLILYQFVGSGKAMFNALDDTWRWRTRVGDKYFGRFWLQAIRFLARSKLLGQKQAEVITDRRRYQRGEPVVVRVRFPNPAIAPPSGDVAVQVERKETKEPRKYELKAVSSVRNLFEGLLPPIREGDYDVRLLPPPVLQGEYPSTSFRIDPPAGERENVQMNEAELLRATSSSGGSFFRVDALDQLFAKLPKPQKVPLDTDPPIELWNTPPILAAFLAILTLEWVLRKRKQLI